MSKKMIGLVIKSLFGGGAEKVFLTLAQHMAEQGHQVHLFLLKNIIDYPLKDTYQIHILSETGRDTRLRFLNNYLLAKRLRKKILALEINSGHQFDLIISTLTDTDRIVYQAQLNRHVYYRICNTLSEEINAYRQSHGVRKARHRQGRYTRIYSQKPLIAVSQGVADDIISNFGAKPDHVRVIYNPIDYLHIQELAQHTVPNLPQEPYIIHVGRFVGQKRHDLLLAAFKNLKSQCKLVLLTQVNAELKALISSYDLEDRVICPGFQPNPYPWIKNARLMVLCSDREGFGLVIAEALVCKTPVISTNCPSGPGEILAGELNHWLVPMDNVQALTMKIEEALNTEIQIPETVLNRFIPAQIVNQYLSLI